MRRVVDESSLVLSFKKERACWCFPGLSLGLGWREGWIASQGRAMTGVVGLGVGCWLGALALRR